MQKLALQLYTVRDAAEKDFTGTMRAIAKSGYDGIEGFGTGPLSEKEYIALMKDLGLESMGAHVGLDQFAGEKLNPTLDFYRRIGTRFMAISHWVKDATPETWKEIATPMNRVGKAAKARGIVFQYHNHAHEFAKFGKLTALEILLAETDPACVKSQLDVGWVTRAGQDAVAWVRKLGKRIGSIHLKDVKMKPKPTWTEVGTGALPLKGVVAAARKLGIPWYVVEQDSWDIPSTTSAAISAANARKVIG